MAETIFSSSCFGEGIRSPVIGLTMAAVAAAPSPSPPMTMPASAPNARGAPRKGMSIALFFIPAVTAGSTFKLSLNILVPT